MLLESAELGQMLGGLLNVDVSVTGVTSGKLRSELKGLGAIAKVGGGQLDEHADLAVTAGWGRRNRNGIGAGRGRVETREFTDVERELIEQGCDECEVDANTIYELLGARTCDLYLNDVAFWRNVPEKVFAYSLGGYPVLKKWLSYREHMFLGRPMRRDEVRLVTQIVRRIAAILLLSPQLDENYLRVAGAAVPLEE